MENIDIEIDFYYTKMASDPIYKDFVIPRDEFEIRKIIKFFITQNEIDIFQCVEDNFRECQILSNELLNIYNHDVDVDQILLIVKKTKDNFSNKVKSLFWDGDLDKSNTILLKSTFADLISIRNKQHSLLKKMERLLDQIFVLSYLTDNFINLEKIKDTAREDLLGKIVGAKHSLVKNIANLEDKIKVNKSYISSLMDFIQVVSPTLFKELMLSHFMDNSDGKNYPVELRNKIDSISIYKKMALEHIEEFYNKENLKKLNKIFKDSENKRLSKIRKDIDDIKEDMEIFLYSIKKIKLYMESILNSLIDDAHYNEDPLINNIIFDTDNMIKNLNSIIDECENKIKFIFSI